MLVSAAYYNITVVWLSGAAVPASNEEVAILLQPGANMRYDSTTLKVYDSSGAVISDPLAYNTLTDAATVGASALANMAFIVKNPSGVSGSPALMYSDGTNIKALNGSYIWDRLVGIQRKIIWPNTGITWTVANNGGTVRATANAAHGLTASPAEGCYMYLTNSPANWTAGTFHKIKTGGIVSTTVIDLETTWVASMGVPIFAMVGTAVTAASFTLPALKADSEVIFDGTIYTNVGTCNRNITYVLDTTTLQDHVFSNASNSFTPEKLGFRNTGATNTQEGLYNSNSNGLVSSGTAQILNGAVDTSAAGKVLKINLTTNTVNFYVQIGNGKLLITE